MIKTLSKKRQVAKSQKENEKKLLIKYKKMIFNKQNILSKNIKSLIKMMILTK